MSKRQLKTLSIIDKLKLIKQIETGRKKADVAADFKIPRSTVSTIWKKKDEIKNKFNEGEYGIKRKRARLCVYSDIDDAVLRWFKVLREKKLPINGPIIKEKALYFASLLGHKNFVASEGWLTKFKQRHDIVGKVMSGEGASVSEADCLNWKNNLPNLLREYGPRNVFNADETGIFFKCLPNRTLSFRNEKCFGGKYGKDRVTCLVGANMAGTEKLKLLLIGKSASPRCFRGIKSLPVDYYSNKNAWMTSEIFTTWLLKLERKFSAENRKILLFVDNCSSHPKDAQQKLKFIRLVYFPPNTTASLQPMDQGIIKNLKTYYKRAILLKMLEGLDNESSIKINLLDCVRMISTSWMANVKPQTIVNCFRKAGFGLQSDWDDDDLLPLATLREKLLHENEAENELNILWDELAERLEEFKEVSCNDYIDIDNDILVHGFPTDEDILAGIGGNEDPDLSDEELEEIVRPRHCEIQTSLDIIRKAVETCDDVPDKVHEAASLLHSFFEKNIIQKQSLITNYFNPKT